MNEPIEIQEVKSFIERFKTHYLTIESFKIESDIARFNGLLSGWKALDSTIASYEKRLASDYNIFYILKNIAHKEVITHSPILTDLLDIHGTHKQGDLFYSEFINQFVNIDKPKFIPNDNLFFSIEENKYIGPIDKDYEEGGTIDIFISYQDSQKSFAIAIENKIYAVDQPRQLHRYNKFLEEVYKNNYLLIYLSPDGREPNMEPIDKAAFEKLKGKKIIILSYQKHIKNLLENTINKVEADNVRSIINQYLQIINNF